MDVDIGERNYRKNKEVYVSQKRRCGQSVEDYYINLLKLRDQKEAHTSPFCIEREWLFQSMDEETEQEIERYNRIADEESEYRSGIY